MRYFALTNKSLKKRNPYRHLPFTEKFQNFKKFKKSLWLQRIYKRPGLSPRPFTYRLPRYKRIQRFFQRNRVYIRRLYGEMRDSQLAYITKKMIQKNDKKRRLYKNISHYLEFNASTFLLINRFYPNVKELRQLVQNKFLMVNGKKINNFYHKMNIYDFCKLNQFTRTNDELFITKKLRFAIWRKIYKSRTIHVGYNNSFTRTNILNDSSIKIKNSINSKIIENSIEQIFFSNINVLYHQWFSIMYVKKKIEGQFFFKQYINKFNFNPRVPIHWMKLIFKKNLLI